MSEVPVDAEVKGGDGKVSERREVGARREERVQLRRGEAFVSTALSRVNIFGFENS